MRCLFVVFSFVVVELKELFLLALNPKKTSTFLPNRQTTKVLFQEGNFI